MGRGGSAGASPSRGGKGYRLPVDFLAVFRAADFFAAGFLDAAFFLAGAFFLAAGFLAVFDLAIVISPWWLSRPAQPAT